MVKKTNNKGHKVSSHSASIEERINSGSFDDKDTESILEKVTVRCEIALLYLP